MCLKWIHSHFTGTAQIYTTKGTVMRFKNANSCTQANKDRNWFHDYFGKMTIHTVLRCQQNSSYFLFSFAVSLPLNLYCKYWNHRLKTQLHFIRNHNNNNRNGLWWFVDFILCYYLQWRRVSRSCTICNGTFNVRHPHAVICHPSRFSPIDMMEVSSSSLSLTLSILIVISRGVASINGTKALTIMAPVSWHSYSYIHFFFFFSFAPSLLEIWYEKYGIKFSYWFDGLLSWLFILLEPI